MRVVLRGIPASAGVANGKVRIVLDPKNIGLVKTGDVLVTEMTDPNYTRGMKKASAVVTDIGGLLCHAAIVARELRIPCIVATQRATKILKNNQAVLVDATKGEVHAL